MVVPFESANYFTEVGKVKMKIYRNGEIEIIDPFPKPYAFAPSKNEIQTQAKMERTDFKAFDTGEAVKRYTFNVPQQVKFLGTSKRRRAYPSMRPTRSMWEYGC